jgi:ATP-dependent Clp protease ATP-binding subunit ClpC
VVALLVEGLTEGANLVLAVARVQARHLDHNAVGTEHLLLGLCSDADTASARLLESRGATHQAVLVRVQSVDRFHDGVPGGILYGHLPLTRRARQALAYALEECLRLRRPVVSASAILLGLIRQEDSRGARVLAELGVDLAEFRAAVLDHQRGG